MKKKFFVGIAAAALAAGMCVAFVGCGEGGSGAEAAKSIKGVEVTAEQWTAAFEALAKDDAEFTITLTAVEAQSVKGIIDPETNQKLSANASRTEEIVYTKKGNKESQITTTTTKMPATARRISIILGASEEELPEKETTTVKEEEYGEKTSEGYMYYEQIDGVWTKRQGGSFAPTDMIEDYEAEYEDFIYSEEHEGYISKYYSAEDRDELEVIKFDKNAKLVAIYFEMPEAIVKDYNGIEGAETSSKYSVSYTFKYSAKDIKLPTVE